MSGRMSSALAWAHGPGSFPARSSSGFRICVTRLPDAAVHAGAVAASLARRGEPIGTFDTLMGAHALSSGLTFVTNNVKHFRRVVGLKTENWV
jgi:hypothetical protein